MGRSAAALKGVATTGSQPKWMPYQKDEGRMAIKRMQKIFRKGEVPLVGDSPWMLPGKRLQEEVKKGRGSREPAAWLFVRCTAGHSFFCSVGCKAGAAFSEL